MKYFVFFFAILFAVLIPAKAARDPLENLIEEESLGSPPSTKIEELPSMFFYGNRTGMKIYSPGTGALDNGGVCHSLELEELVQLSKGGAGEFSMDVNLSIPRVKKMFEDACLIRPGDFAVALSPQFQKTVTIKRFSVQRDAGACALGSPYSLWAHFEEFLEQDPLLFSTDLNLPEGFNSFRLFRDIPEVPMNGEVKAALGKATQFLSDYDVRLYPLESTNSKMVAHLRRHQVDLEDDGMFNEILMENAGEGFSEFWVEKIDKKNGTGHIRLEGVWDYNGDGLTDLLISGDHQGCPYQMLFKGLEKGFEAQDLPNEPCHC